MINMPHDGYNRRTGNLLAFNLIQRAENLCLFILGLLHNWVMPHLFNYQS